MKIILLEDVKGLGEKGELVSAKPGYFRNYLLPKKLAIQATAENKKKWKEEQKRKKEEFKENKAQAQALKEKLEKESIQLKVKSGPDGRLFGSVTANDIAKALEDRGYEVDKRKIELSENIKETGKHTVGIRVFPEMLANLELEVVEE